MPSPKRQTLTERQAELENARSAPADAAEVLANDIRDFCQNNEKLRFVNVDDNFNTVTITRTGTGDVLRIKCFGIGAWTIDDAHLIDLDDLLDEVLTFLGA